MARTFQRIQDDIYFSILQSDLSPLLSSTSKTAVWKLWVFVFAYAIWIHEQIVEKNALNSRPQSLANFKAMIENFHDGLQLVYKNHQFQYDLTNVTDAADRKIISRCAVLESNNEEIVIKLARTVNGVLQPLSAEQLIRIEHYIKQNKVPGIPVRIINRTADLLKFSITVYVDISIIDTTTGKLLNVSDEVYPVKDAINNYLDNLEFNGAFVTDFFRSEIKSAQGIKLTTIQSLQWKYASYPYQNVEEWKVPESGYFKYNDNETSITYLDYALVNN